MSSPFAQKISSRLVRRIDDIVQTVRTVTTHSAVFPERTGCAAAKEFAGRRVREGSGDRIGNRVRLRSPGAGGLVAARERLFCLATLAASFPQDCAGRGRRRPGSRKDVERKQAEQPRGCRPSGRPMSKVVCQNPSVIPTQHVTGGSTRLPFGPGQADLITWGRPLQRARIPLRQQVSFRHWRARYEDNLYYWTGSKDL